ncbi:MAG: hypothetical protein QXD97_06210 [Acidilobaceae archaeon]
MYTPRMGCASCPALRSCYQATLRGGHGRLSSPTTQGLQLVYTDIKNLTETLKPTHQKQLPYPITLKVIGYSRIGDSTVYRIEPGTCIQSLRGSVKRGYIEVISILNIVPTIAEILGIDRPKDSISAPLPIKTETLIIPTTTTLQTTTTLTKTIESIIISLATMIQTSTVENLD